MQQTLKHFFIPHAGNDYHPHILHTKRTALYAGVCLLVKGAVFLFVFLLPAEVFMLPDVLEQERVSIIALTNTLRAAPLAEHRLLNRSATMKTADMAANHYFDHVGPNARNLHYFIAKAGYPYSVAGENLAMGFSSARDVMRAWEDSPTHFANLVDPDFHDIGIGIEAGTYQGIPTVFVTQHFGQQKKTAAAALASLSEGTASHDIPAPPAPIQEARGEKATAPDALSSSTLPAPPPLSIESDRSHVAWQETSEGGLALSAIVYIEGKAQSVEVFLRGHKMVLSQVETAQDTYIGSIEIAESPRTFFAVITMPTVRVTGEDGRVATAPIRWDRILVLGPTPIEKYIQSKSVLGPFTAVTSVFTVEKGIYLGFIVFFTLALVLNIIIEIRKQHPHVIFQTSALLMLLLVLFIV